jgi:hypothetical protein
MPTDPKSKAGHSLPSLWKEFLSELDSMLPEPLDLHCIGGFVICYFYGLPRPTGDIDYYSAVPTNLNLIEMAGEGSALSKKYKIQLHHVAVTNLPEDYATRLTEMFPRVLKNLRLFAPDAYDFILSKPSPVESSSLPSTSRNRSRIPAKPTPTSFPEVLKPSSILMQLLGVDWRSA